MTGTEQIEVDPVDKILNSYGWFIDGWGRIYYGGFENKLVEETI